MATKFINTNPKVDPNKTMKVSPMPKGGDVTKAPQAEQVTTTTKQKAPTVTTTKAKPTSTTVDIGATKKPTFVAPADYNTGLSQYRALAGSKNQADLKARRNLASWLVKNKPSAVTAPTVPPADTTGGTVAGSTETPPTTDEDIYFGGGDQQATSLLPPELWNQVLQGLSQQGGWQSDIRLPTQQELADLYNKAYQEQLAGLSIGVDEKQAREQKMREQYLADRGISLDSQAYRNEQASLADMQAQENARLRAEASQFAQQRADSEFNRASQASTLEMDRARLEQDLKYRGLEALTPLVTAQTQMGENRWLAKFNANTQERLQGLQLDAEESQFVRSLDQRQSQHMDLLAEQVASRVQDKEQFEKEMKFETKKWMDDIKLRTKEYYQSIRQSTALTKLEKDKLIELTRNNKASEAIALLNAKKAGGGAGAEDADAIYNRYLAVARAKNQGDKERKEMGLDEEGSGGISYGFGG